MDPKILNLINLIYVAVFIFLVYLVLIRIGKRYIDYKRQGLEVPYLLKRDFLFFSGLSVPFVTLLFIRLLGIVPVEEWWYPFWIIGSGALALIGTAYWVYVEYFIIEKDK